MKRPLALDLFCKAGGASVGLHRAGFDVVGVDIAPQPRYPFEFVQADVRNHPFDLSSFDFIWASPPCQAFSLATKCRPGVAETHKNLIPLTRRILQESGTEWCIENVPLAPLQNHLILTGCMFGLNTYRKRKFELSFFILAPKPGRPFGPESKPGTFTIAGHTGNSSLKTRKAGVDCGTKEDWQRAIGIDWMTVNEMANAVPPVYAEFIGRAAIKHLASPLPPAPASAASRCVIRDNGMEAIARVQKDLAFGANND